MQAKSNRRVNMMDDLSFIVDISQEEQKTKYLTLQYILEQ